MWQTLQNSPVVVALAQLKFNVPNFKMEDVVKQCDVQLKHTLPIRRNNIQVGLNFGRTAIPLGESKVSGVSNAEIGSYIYYTKSQKIKLEISKDTITFIDENPYLSWENFKSQAIDYLKILSPVFANAEVSRISIRFVNRFTLDDFTNPEEYINTLITSKEGETTYPLSQYGFRLMMDVPQTDIYTIVNHNVENASQGKYLYTLDIDVLDRQKLVFDIDTISDSLENLRNIRNKIFFDTITNKTIELCN
ncbi:MAG: TIGR04255 family protein [Paludibacteraceae bacterium]|nr:TIGR04255 family protein [Paludibacteraceae bacterium]